MDARVLAALGTIDDQISGITVKIKNIPTSAITPADVDSLVSKLTSQASALTDLSAQLDALVPSTVA